MDNFSPRKIFSKDLPIRQRRRRSEHYRLNARCGTMSARDIAYVLKAAAVFARTIRKSSAADQSFPNREAHSSTGGQVSSIRCIVEHEWGKYWQVFYDDSHDREGKDRVCTGICNATITPHRSKEYHKRASIVLLLPGWWR